MANRSFHIFVAVVVLSSAHGISPAQDVHNTLLTFRALGDVPYNETEYQQLARHVADLQPSAAFVVHIGDIKSGSSPCEETVYERVAGILLDSPPPLFIIPGDNEWNDCSNISPDEAWGFWQNNFQRFDELIPRFPRTPPKRYSM